MGAYNVLCEAARNAGAEIRLLRTHEGTALTLTLAADGVVRGIGFATPISELDAIAPIGLQWLINVSPTASLSLAAPSDG